MDCKEFFRLRLAKAILWVILLILSVIAGYIALAAGVTGGGNTLIAKIIIDGAYVTALPAFLLGLLSLPSNWLFYALTIVILVIYWYLLSCLIVYLYQAIRKK